MLLAQKMTMLPLCRLLLPVVAVATLQLASCFLSSPQNYVTNKINRREITHLFVDHSSATVFQIGDTVTVIEDVMKAGKSLRGRSGEVIETWEKCDVDPTCCCAEWVDDGLSVHVRFSADEDSNTLFANDTFIHYFAESELVKKKNKENKDESSNPTVAFDGLSCTAFKLDKLKMGEQAQRIAAFEQSRSNQDVNDS